MRIGRQITGGKYKKARKKKLTEKSRQRRIVKLGDEKRKNIPILSGKNKTVLFQGKTINVHISPGKIKKTEIKNVSETPSNRFLARQNVITKGTIVETSLGFVRITNRPSQEGSINGILIKKE